jgi:hypothetical protein
MIVDPEMLEDAIRQDDPGTVRNLLRDATEADRRKCAKALAQVLEIPWRGNGAFLAAAVGLAGGVRAAVDAAQSYGFPSTAADLDAIAGVLADRRPGWLANFTGKLLSSSPQIGIAAWPLTRRLVRLGAIDRPGIPEYTTGLVSGCLHEYLVEVPDGWQVTVTVTEALLADPGLLDEEVWRLFTVPDAGRVLGTLGDYWLSRTDWPESLALLSEQGHLDRDRLIDACLDAFSRDFAPNRVGWYASFHDRMDPSLAEMGARAGKYLSLLGANSKPGITVGQRGAGQLLDAGLLEPSRFLAASGPALLSPQKSVAMAQLKLIGRAAAKEPAIRDLAMTVASQAFGHQREDVQAAALALLRKHGVPGGEHAAEIRELAGALSPVLAREAAAIGLGPAAGRQAAGPHGEESSGAGLDELAESIDALPAARVASLRVALAAARQGQVSGPAQVRPSAGHPLPEPIEDPEELVELLTVLMEDASDAIAVERVLAGAVRLAARPEAERGTLVGPLLARAKERAGEDYYGAFSGCEIRADMARVALAWGKGWAAGSDRWPDHWMLEHWVSARPSGEAKTMAGVLSCRAREVAAVIRAGRPVRLLAEPAFERGASSQQRLLDRLAGWRAAFPGRPPARYDLQTALLRLEPGAGESFWTAWASVDEASAMSARRLYQEGQAHPEFEPVIGQPPGKRPLRGYNEWHTHVLARIAGQLPGPVESDTWALLTALSDPLADHTDLYGPSGNNPHYDAVVAAWPLICPWQPELIAAHLLRPLSDGLKPGPSPATTAVTCLAHPGHPLGPVGHLALLTGLASAEPDTRIAAAQVWSQASLDGRLDPRLAAQAIITGVAGEAFKLTRIADGLQHASHVPIAGYRIVETVCEAAAALIEAAPANLHLLLGLATRVGVRVGLPDLPSAITDLAARKGESRLVIEAARLAQVGADPAPDLGHAIAGSLAALVDRAGAAPDLNGRRVDEELSGGRGCAGPLPSGR